MNTDKLKAIFTDKAVWVALFTLIALIGAHLGFDADKSMIPAIADAFVWFVAAFLVRDRMGDITIQIKEQNEKIQSLSDRDS